MARDVDARTGGHRPAVTTPDELVVQLREAGAKRVYLSRTDAFRDGTIPITATYELTPADRPRNSGAADERKLLRRVFDAIDDRLWVHGREWTLEWAVEPAFTDPQLELIPLYDRSVEHKHGDGFALQNLLFVYEEYHELNEP